MLSEFPQRHNEEPGKPHTFATPLYADTIHPVVPVTASHQRQSVLAHCASPSQRTDTVVVKRFDNVRYLRQLEQLHFLRVELSHPEIWHSVVEYRGIAGQAEIVIHDVRKPDEIVRESRPNAPPALRMPPVLHVSFLKLS